MFILYTSSGNGFDYIHTVQSSFGNGFDYVHTVQYSLGNLV